MDIWTSRTQSENLLTFLADLLLWQINHQEGLERGKGKDILKSERLVQEETLAEHTES